MGKYSNLIILSDIDGTLIDDNMQIPASNMEAIDYFRREGGKFTVCTGRTLEGAMYYLERLKTDLPMICQNGSAIYDLEKTEYVWLNPLPKSASDLIRYVESTFPHMGIEIITPHHIYFYRENHATYLHKTNEDLTTINADYNDISSPWVKIVFADEPENIDILQHNLESSIYCDEYKLLRSHTIFYEAISKTTNKGIALSKLCEMMNLDFKNIIVAGDNDNDIELLSSSALSFAPANAFENAKKSADVVLKSDNNNGLLPEILQNIDKLLLN